MLNGADTRRVYESFCRGDIHAGGVDGPRGFATFVFDLCGLTLDQYGRRRVSRTIEAGPDKGKAAIDPAAFSFRDLALGICGDDWVAALDPARHRGAVNVLPNAAQLKAFESATGPVGPGSFPNVSAWVHTVSGLLEIKALGGFESPEYVAGSLMPTIPTRLRREKMPAIGRIGDQAQPREPGDVHQRVGMTERYIWTPETVNHGLAIDVLKETVFYDLTAQVMTRAETLGTEMGLRRDKRQWQVILGLVNPYVYGDVAYNTYTTTGVVINKMTATLQDWTDLNEARTLASRMTDQESGERIAPTYDTLYVMPGRVDSANSILNATEIERRTASEAEIRRAPNREAGRYSLVSSSIAEQMLIESGVSPANALEYWGIVNSKKAFAYMENWGITIVTPQADGYQQADRGILFSQFLDESGAAAVIERRYAIQAVP